MAFTFGDYNPGLSKAINRVSKNSASIRFVRHAREAMEDDDFDDSDVLAALRKGKAYGPEQHSGRMRANVIHQGIHIRVSVGGLEHAADNWEELAHLTVVTVMRMD